MPKLTTQFTLSISSPSDMEADRDAVKVAIEELDDDEALSATFRLQHWQKDVLPDVGEDAQNVISEQIFNNCDIFIALIGSKLGTPTARAQSGTVEEIEDALNRLEIVPGHHKVQVYFRRIKVDILDADTKEIERIQKFRTTLEERGVFYYAYEQPSDLQRMVRKTTRRCVLTWKAEDQSDAQSPISHQEKSQPIHDDDDLGILDYAEIFETSLNISSTNIRSVTDRLSDFTDYMRTKTIETAAIAGKTTGEKKKFINEFAKRMSEDATYIREDLEVAAIKTKEALAALAAGLRIHSEESTTDKDFSILASSIEYLMDNSEKILETQSDIVPAIAQLPRLTSDFNRAKRQMLEALDLLRVIASGVVAQGNGLKAQLKDLRKPGPSDQTL